MHDGDDVVEEDVGLREEARRDGGQRDSGCELREERKPTKGLRGRSVRG